MVQRTVKRFRRQACFQPFQNAMIIEHSGVGDSSFDPKFFRRSVAAGACGCGIALKGFPACQPAKTAVVCYNFDSNRAAAGGVKE